MSETTNPNQSSESFAELFEKTAKPIVEGEVTQGMVLDSHDRQDQMLHVAAGDILKQRVVAVRDRLDMEHRCRRRPGRVAGEFPEWPLLDTLGRRHGTLQNELRIRGNLQTLVGHALHKR